MFAYSKLLFLYLFVSQLLSISLLTKSISCCVLLLRRTGMVCVPNWPKWLNIAYNDRYERRKSGCAWEKWSLPIYCVRFKSSFFPRFVVLLSAFLSFAIFLDIFLVHRFFCPFNIRIIWQSSNHNQFLLFALFHFMCLAYSLMYARSATWLVWGPTYSGWLFSVWFQFNVHHSHLHAIISELNIQIVKWLLVDQLKIQRWHAIFIAHLFFHLIFTAINYYYSSHTTIHDRRDRLTKWYTTTTNKTMHCLHLFTFLVFLFSHSSSPNEDIYYFLNMTVKYQKKKKKKQIVIEPSILQTKNKVFPNGMEWSSCNGNHRFQLTMKMSKTNWMERKWKLTGQWNQWKRGSFVRCTMFND